MRPVRSERGSLPLVMMAILVVGSLVTVLVGGVVVGQRQSRFDQSFEQSLPIAEVGLERMVYLVSSRQQTDDFSLPEIPLSQCVEDDGFVAVLRGQPPDPALSECWVMLAGGRYRGAAKRLGRKWTLTAEGAVNRPCSPMTSPTASTPCETRRILTLTIDMESVFGVAAFGRTQVDLQGSNSADSYRSGTFSQSRLFSELALGSNICRSGFPADPMSSSDSSGTRMCTPTGKGVVATNGELFLKGGVIDSVDRAEVHYAREVIVDRLPDATGFCRGVDATCDSAKLAYFREPIVNDPDPVVPPARVMEVHGNRGSFPPAPTSPPRDCPSVIPAGTTSCLPPGIRIYTNMTLDSKTFIEGTPENPSIVYLTGTLAVPNGEVVNFRRNSLGNWVPKPAPGLLIFSAGVGPALRFGNHASFSGAVYAPRATFSGGAAGNIYGSIVTGSISTQGSWNFHYDEALGDVETEARFVVSGWAER